MTGGAGFIGSHVADRLVARGYRVRVLDSLEPQVHGESAGYRNQEVEYSVGSILDASTTARALSDVDAVVHLAAQVGVGQSMYDMRRYLRENCEGTASLLEELAQRRGSVTTLIVASSMSIYGEGQYRCTSCETDDARVHRPSVRLEAGEWEPQCLVCGSIAEPIATSEDKRLEPSSVYAVTKRDQEELCLVAAPAYGVRATALRFFNVYGSRQSLSNPYTGVAAIFAARLLNGNSPLVFEDGAQSRDFVHVSDVARGIELALEREKAAGAAINLGTGRATTVLGIGRALADELGVDMQPTMTAQFRVGDIRHCFADIERARDLLGYEPLVGLADGLKDLADWIRVARPPAVDRVEMSTRELVERGLVV
ncbi:MAG TPA: NAD-dependent epimerase/dehydratase family protein [Acidimicrobiales bacterium]|nr:NAD-dependent epimerase/dehydratase family protein [Acidimicrobiales bacterium]